MHGTNEPTCLLTALTSTRFFVSFIAFTFSHRNMPACGTCHSAKSVKHKLHYFHFHFQEHARLWDVPLSQVCQTQATLLSLSATGTCQPVGRATQPSLSNTSYITFTFSHRNMPACGTCHSAKSVKHNLHYFHFQPQEHATLWDVPLSQVCQTQATLLSLSTTGTCQPVGRATQPSLSNTGYITFTFNHRNMPACGTCHSAKSVKHKLHYFHFQPQEHASLWDVPLGQVCQTQATLLSLSTTGTCQPVGRATRPSLSNTSYITFTFNHRNMPACGTCHSAKSVKHKLHYFHFHFQPQEHASLWDVPLGQVCETQATLLSLSAT